ncbi:MAG: alpha/beta hydrolase [Aquihabitans sp.]
MTDKGEARAPGGLHVVHHDGDGTDLPVVLVHGGMDRATSFGRVVRNLGDMPAIRYDRRGYGRSSVGAAATLAEHVDDLIGVIDGVPVVVFGHSIGGVVALVAAERRPDLIRGVMVYESPVPWMPGWPLGSIPDPEEDPADRAERFMRRMVGDRLWERLPPSTRDARRAEGPALDADLASMRQTVPPVDAAGLNLPVLCAAGDEGDEWHRRAVEYLASTIPGAALEIVDGAGHGVHLTHPKVTASLIRSLRSMAS